ncbi:MAG: MlaD family protein [bacterium]
MLSKKNTDFKVGVTVLVGIVLLLLGVGWAKGWKLGSQEHLLIARFPSAGGIEQGDPVFIQGINHGKVASVTTSATGEVQMTLDIDETVALHKDATASIMMLELMSGKKVEILAGSTGSFDPKRDTLFGTYEGDLSSLIASIGAVSKNFPLLIRNIDSVLASVNDLFAAGELKKKTFTILDDAERSMKLIQSVIAENRSGLKSTIEEAEKLTKTLNNSIAPGAMALMDSTKQFIHRAGHTLDGADSLLAGLNEIITHAKDKKSLIYKLTSDPEFANRLDSLLISGHKLVDQLRLQGLDANIRFFKSSTPEK